MAKVLITGCYGFIGSNLFKKLVDCGHDVYGVGRSVSEAIDSNIINSYVCIDSLNKVYEQSGHSLDVIIHTAGSSSVGDSEKEPALSFDNTVMSSQILFEWVRHHVPMADVVVTSSAAVYGDIYNRRISDSDDSNPCSVYGEHKLIVERLGKMYNRTYGIKIKFARIFSVYGTGLKKQFLWDFCTKLEQAVVSELILFGSGNEVRDWVHVDDACDQIINIAFNGTDKVCYNVGTGKGITVKEVAELLMSESSRHFDLKFNSEFRKGDPFYLVSEGGLLNTKVDIKEGISRYVKWFKQQNKTE